MRHVNNEKRQTTQDGRNQTTKSRKKKDRLEKSKCTNTNNIEAGTIKQMEMKEKYLKNVSGECHSKPN